MADDTEVFLGWTVNTLRTHLMELTEQRAKALDKRIDDAQASNSNALKLAADSVTATLAATDVTVKKSDASAEKRFQDFGERIASIEQRLNSSEGRGSGMNASWLIIVAVAMVGIELLNMFLQHHT
jgi:hypothetical protein